MASSTPATLSVVIETPRLRLEPLAARHAAPMFASLQDPSLYRWINLQPPSTVEALAMRWARVADALATAGGVIDLAWAVQRREDGAWIGKLDAEVHPDGVADPIGYLFFSPFHGQGYGSEAVAAMAGHLARCGVVEQRAAVTVGNVASERVLQRAGFVRHRVIAGNDVIRGVAVDDVEYVRRD